MDNKVYLQKLTDYDKVGATRWQFGPTSEVIIATVASTGRADVGTPSEPAGWIKLLTAHEILLTLGNRYSLGQKCKGLTVANTVN